MTRVFPLLTVLTLVGCAGAIPPLRGELDTVVPVSVGSPYGAAVSSQGLAYVTIHGGVSALTSWDFTTRRATHRAVTTGVEPTNVVFAPGGDVAFVASQWSGGVDRVDVARSTTDALWVTPGNDPYQVAVAPDGRRIYVTGNAGFLFVFDAGTGTLIGQVRTAAAPNGLAFAADGRTVYVTHLLSREIGAVETETLRYRRFAELDGAQGHGIALALDGRTLYVVSTEANELCRFEAPSGDRRACVVTAREPFGLAVTADGRELWVTTLRGTVQRFRSADLSTIGSLEVGGRLRRIAMDPAGRGAIVADESGRILVFR